MLFGPDKRTCLENGTWSSSIPECRECMPSVDQTASFLLKDEEVVVFVHTRFLYLCMPTLRSFWRCAWEPFQNVGHNAQFAYYSAGLFAGHNLALGKSSLQSSTLWNYEPGLAVDSDPDSCSFTPRSSEQRWWQVHLGDASTVQAVAITISPGSYQKFTIFVIGLFVFIFL